MYLCKVVRFLVFYTAIRAELLIVCIVSAFYFSNEPTDYIVVPFSNFIASNFHSFHALFEDLWPVQNSPFLFFV